MSRSLIILSLSLCLNGLLIGLFIGQKLHSEQPQYADRPLLQMIRNLPPEMRAPLRQALIERRPELQQAIGESRQALLQIQQLARQPDVQEAQLRQAFEQLHTGLEHLQQPLYQAIIQSLMATPAAVRQNWRTPLAPRSNPLPVEPFFEAD
ncbi:putative membrane protein [Azomonas agilis]|uniref:Signaling pathway modulator ZraP n=1 Tax=Azomonas agilis TaxID=116849 RepID=A0A562IYL7_9GAMM|nr:periplasmic heavy metal sensor [Azomonas agilis]TWH75986.1 putative membrane protein [Azomonas agilis]